MKLKKLTASILAAALALTAIPLSVSAENEETKKLPLVTADLSEIHGATGIASVGRGVYFYFVDGGIKGAVRISDEQLKSWKETGELSYTDINTDGLFTDSTVKYSWYVNITFNDGDYMTLFSKDEDGNQLSRFAVRYDEKANTIVKVKDFEPPYTDNSYRRTASITHKGYTVSKSQDIENSTFTITAYAPDGTEAFSNTYDGVVLEEKSHIEDKSYYSVLFDLWISRNSEKYCCYVFALTEVVEEELERSPDCKYTIFAIDYSGETTQLYSNIINHTSWPIYGTHPYMYDGRFWQVAFYGPREGVDGYLYLDDEKGIVYSYGVYNSQSNYTCYDDVIVKPDLEKLLYNEVNSIYCGAVDMNENIIAGCYKFYIRDIGEYRYLYALIDVEKNEIISDIYAEITKSSDGGETYLAKTLDGKCVFIDKNGKELGVFDGASSFCDGEYAPVIVDGKAYIINRNMEFVTEGVQADEVYFLNKNVECFKQGDEYILINVFSETEEEEPPVTEPEATAPEETAPATEPEETTPNTKPEETAPTTEPEKTTPAESEISNTFTDSSEDKAADVQVIANESVIPSNAVFTVKLVNNSSTDTRYAYDLTFTVDGKEYQPNGTVTVKIPVPEALKDSADTLKVYHLVDGNYTDMKAKLDNGYLVFETDHFSTYVVTAEDLDPDKAPPTGVAIGIAPITVLAALVIAAKKRK